MGAIDIIRRIVTGAAALWEAERIERLFRRFAKEEAAEARGLTPEQQRWAVEQAMKFRIEDERG